MRIEREREGGDECLGPKVRTPVKEHAAWPPLASPCSYYRLVPVYIEIYGVRAASTAI
jgi:hypothetical protein